MASEAPPPSSALTTGAPQTSEGGEPSASWRQGGAGERTGYIVDTPVAAAPVTGKLARRAHHAAKRVRRFGLGITLADAAPQAGAGSPGRAAPVAQADALSLKDIIYKKPPHLSFDQDTPVSLVVEMQGPNSGAAALADLPGQMVSATVRLSDTATAVLTGPRDEVSIRQDDPPQDRNLMPGANAQWMWSVRALRPGSAILTLEIYTTVMHDGTKTSYQMKTYTDKFPIQISYLSWTEWEIARIRPIWAFLGLGTPTALGAMIFRYLRRRASKKLKAPPAIGTGAPAAP